MKISSLIVISFLLLTPFFIKVNAQSLTWLGTLGGETSNAYDVSDDGTIVVGESEIYGDNTRAFIWTPGTGMQPLTNLQNISSWAVHISSDGNSVIGTARTINGINYQAIKWWRNDGVITFLGTLGGSGSLNNSEGFSCNANGSVIVGTAATISNSRHAFKWTASGGMEDLGTFGNVATRFSAATGISDDASLIAGHSEYGGYFTRPCFWLNGSINELLTAFATSIERGEVTNVSPNGNYICGWIDDSTTFSNENAYLWSGNPSFTGFDIGLLPLVALDQGTSKAFDVNDNGEVVGTATDTLYEDNAFYWYYGVYGVIENLNLTYGFIIPFGSKLISANAISNNGRYIVGQGYNIATNRNEAFLLDRGGATSIENSEELPNNFSLEQNYPNPFNASTKIKYVIPNGVRNLVTLKVYDILGNEVATLVNEEKPAGVYEVEFDASKLSSGIYFYKLSSGSFTETKKMTVLK